MDCLVYSIKWAGVRGKCDQEFGKHAVVLGWEAFKVFLPVQYVLPKV